MSDESVHYSFRCHPADDADIIAALDKASRLERSRLIKRLIRAGLAQGEAPRNSNGSSAVPVHSGSFSQAKVSQAQAVEDLTYEDIDTT